MQANNIYIRVKRDKTTIFLDCSPQDTVTKLKEKLSLILNKEKDPRDLRLWISSKATGSASTTAGAAAPAVTATPGGKDAAAAAAAMQYTALEDTAVVDHLGLVDDSILYLSYWLSNEANAADGKWEPVKVVEFEPLEGGEPTPDAKGKAKA